MSIVMKKIYAITGNYTPEEKIILAKDIDLFRLRMSDDDPDKNILNKKISQYTDDVIVKLIYASLGDINSGFPITNFKLVYFNDNIDDDLLVQGAMIFALMREGFLQLRNQVDFNDSGLTIGMFNKTGLYQGWAGFLIQEYMVNKKNIKRSILPMSNNAGFLGISSEFSYSNSGW